MTIDTRQINWSNNTAIYSSNNKMTTRIGKLLLQITPLPLDIIEYCIEPYLGIREEEVIENKRKLELELSWVFLYDKIIRPRHIPRNVNLFLMFTPQKRKDIYFHIVWEKARTMRRIDKFTQSEILHMIDHYMSVLHEPRLVIWNRIHKPKTKLDKFLSWIGCTYNGVTHEFTGIKVNLKTKEVSINFIHHHYK